MAYADLLVHTATVYRRSEQRDRFGQPRRDGQPELTLKCRLTGAKGGEAWSERARDTVSATHELFLLPGADLRERDTVDVVGESGKVLAEDAEVILVRPVYDKNEEHHREALLANVREST